MISDPKTTPRSRRARLAFAAIVACTAFALSLRSVQNPVIWALFFCATLTPVLDALTEEKSACVSPQPVLSQP